MLTFPRTFGKSFRPAYPGMKLLPIIAYEEENERKREGEREEERRRERGRKRKREVERGGGRGSKLECKGNNMLPERKELSNTFAPKI